MPRVAGRVIHGNGPAHDAPDRAQDPQEAARRNPHQIAAESRDLTDGVDFKWKAYLACRMDNRDIIGPGLNEERAGSNRRTKDSWYNNWCYQTYGGQGWVKVFFAFGSVDERMVQIFNEEWAEKKLQEKSCRRTWRRRT